MGQSVPAAWGHRLAGPFAHSDPAAIGHTCRIVTKIEALRREHQWSAARIAAELDRAGTPVGRRTVSRLLHQLGLNARVSPAISSGGSARRQQPTAAKRPGQFVHLIVRRGGSELPDNVFLHSAIDRYSRLAYTEALPDEHPGTVVAFLGRAKARFAAHGIARIERVIDGSGSSYRAAAYRDVVSARGADSIRTSHDSPESH